MISKSIIFFVSLLSLQAFGQTPTVDNSNKSDWKKIIVYHSFDITKKKKNIPTHILKKINIDSISEIANPRHKWNSSCTGCKNQPRAKLNWAAFTPDKLDWVISVTRGGYSASTTYYLIASDTVIVIRNSGWTGENFKGFQEKYVADTIKK